MYNQDFNLIAFYNIPPFLRKEKILAFINALILPIIYVYNQFYNWRLDILDKIQNNAQVIVLENFLKTKFNNNNIYILDDNTYIDTHIYNVGEMLNDEVYLYNKAENVNEPYIYNAEETTLYDFAVCLPASIYNNSYYEVKKIVDYYKLTGTKYIIQII